MEGMMLQLTDAVPMPPSRGVALATDRPAEIARSLVDRVREAAARLGCPTLWARSSGRHVLLGLSTEEAFARVTPLGDSAYGLAFRTLAPDTDACELDEVPAPLEAPRWEPVLLVDGLADVVEHALIAVDALPSGPAA